MPTVADALAGAGYQAPSRSGDTSVLVAGAACRLGERVLARVLGTSRYRRIYALASDAMPSSEAKLTALRQLDWTHRVDEVIAVVSAEEISPSVPSRNRTAVFSMLTVDQIVPLARQAKSLGVSRFMIVTPTNILLQPSALYAQLANQMEAELHRIGFESLLILRPSDHEMRQRQKGWPMRLLALLVDTVSGLMAGTRHTPLSIEDIARATVCAMQDSAPGLSILEPDRLHQFLKP